MEIELLNRANEVIYLCKALPNPLSSRKLNIISTFATQVHVGIEPPA